MKIRIALGAGMLLTMGAAVAGTLIYSGDASHTASEAFDTNVATINAQEVTPEMIAMWKANSVSANYISPKVPI